MATAQDLIDQSLAKIGVIAPGETPASEERDRGLVVLNQMIGGWMDVIKRTLAGSYAADYYTFTAISSFATLGTTVTLSQGWQRAFVYGLAMELAPEFGRQLSPDVVAIATQAKMAVVTLPSVVI